MQAGEQVKVPAVCAITAVEMLTHRPPPSKARRGVQPLCGLGGGGEAGWERLFLQAGRPIPMAPPRL